MRLSPVWLLLLFGFAAQGVFFVKTIAPLLRGKRESPKFPVSSNPPESPESPESLNPKNTPLPWWLVALAGGVCILIFAALRRDAVLLVGQCFVLALYLRYMPRGAGTARIVSRDED
jgi:hypothetical protein